MKTKVFLAALALFATTSLISAQTEKTTVNSESKKSCYVDANNDNVCDKHADKTCTTGNGKGLMDGSGKGKVLNNGAGKGLHNGTGKGHKKGNCTNKNNAKGPNYVDTNKNGVCDNSEK